MYKKLFCQLLKRLSRPKQLKKHWNKNIIRFFTKISFKNLNKVTKMIIYYENKEILIVSIYINDFPIILKKLDTI